MKKIFNTKFKLFKNQKGMTLIELLAVVTILGIIAAIAVPAIGGTINNSKKSSDVQTADLIKDAAVRYLIDTNPSNTTVTTSVTTADLLANGYLKAIPQKQSASPVADFTAIAVTYSPTVGWTATGTTPSIP